MFSSPDYSNLTDQEKIKHEVDDGLRDQMITRVVEPAVSGRKLKQESRSAEFRQRLIQWKQTPVAFRRSLRALARKLGTSHQLLAHYLVGLAKWQCEERYRKAKKESDEICARAKAENRNLTFWEEQQVRACDRALIQALVAPALIDTLESIKREAKRGPLNRHQIKMLKLFARAFPEAQELLQKLQSSVKNQKNNLPVISPCVAKSFRYEQR
jgi:hypothetical protein